MSENNPYVQEMKHSEDELAIAYLPAVKAMAFRLKERLPSSVDYSDLAAIATEELVKLARRYDEQQNDSFWGYAKTRVYGSMLDYLRSLDVVSRSNRKLIKQIDQINARYLDTYNREATDSEIAQETEQSVEKVHQARIASDIYTVMPIHDQLSVGDEGESLRTIEQESLVQTIKSALESLNEREQMVIQLYYFEELTLKEISAILDITESRISQIHKSVIKKVRLSLGEP